MALKSSPLVEVSSMFEDDVTRKKRAGIVVFSGGSAANHLVDVFDQVIEAKDCRLSYVIPISDNGGSSSELIRFFGGPGIGDLRSRLVRLIPEDDEPPDPERRAIRTFFNHRLSGDTREARMEWLDIVEARHELWTSITTPKKELIRSFLNFLNAELVKRARPSSVFAYELASIGNLFLTGARLFTGSLESAIYLLSSICTIPAKVSVLPAINTNFSHHICAGLENGDIIPGQNAISHPSAPSVVQPHAGSSHESQNSNGYATPALDETEHADSIEDANLPGSLPTLRKQYIAFSKMQGDEDDLPSRIKRIWYINPYGQEIRPPANPKIIEAIDGAQSIIYSIGSLYTSLVPSIVLRGIGDAIRRSVAGQKILILNGCIDRETGPRHDPYTAIDFVKAIARAGLESRGMYGRPPNAEELRSYVTHLVHLEGDGVPKVDKTAFHEAGIETVRLYGRREVGDTGARYDVKALTQALTALVGQKAVRLDKSRRNTLVN